MEEITTKFVTSGHLRVVAVCGDDRRVLVDKKNQIVNDCLLTLAELVTQKAAINTDWLAAHSLWVEASDTALTQGVSATDTGPDPASTVVKRYEFDRSTDVDTQVGGEPGLVEFRAVLTKQEANGETIRAAGLYTAGDDPATNGLDNNEVRLIARQVFGAIDKDQEFALEFTWRLQFKIG